MQEKALVDMRMAKPKIRQCICATDQGLKDLQVDSVVSKCPLGRH